MRFEQCRASWLRPVPTPCSHQPLHSVAQALPDGSGAIAWLILGMAICGFQNTLVEVIGVDECDGEAMLDHAARELHHGYNVALGRVADDQSMRLAHLSLSFDVCEYSV
ncbi:hypothetical protein AMTRI_Chr10g360 [Amborella trichopoda]